MAVQSHAVRLCNVPATFERLMKTVLKGLTFEACLIYLDDVIIGGRTFEEHLQKYPEEGVRTDPEKVSAVKNGNALKTSKALTSSPILIYPQPDKPFILDTDASNESVGAVLSQEIDGRERVVAYWSQVARWIQRLNEYYFDIRHRKGSSHGNADALSRRPCPENCRHCSRVETKYDYAIRQITTSTATPPDPWEWCSIPKIRIRGWKDIRVAISTSSISYPRGTQRIAWQPNRGGHFGVMKTLHRVRERFCWGKVRADVEQWCKSCDACSARKGPKIRSRGKLHRYNVGAPFERIAFDILGPLPRTASGNKYLLFVIDYFTKWTEVYPIPDQEAPTVAEAVVQHWISRYGVPLQLHSDQEEISSLRY
ncbi:retrovirus-related Pol polyprotein from transposon 412 [Trichonephila clavipes]|nr:retrovirus-related Pol polyprotein from transposon 412 [Trichonephila clavipes]